ESFWAYGTILAGVVAITVLPNFGWRWAFAIGALPALYVAYLRRALPESPRYLAEKGRAPEADAIVRRVERAGGGALLTLAPAIAPTRSGRTRIAELWRPAHARRTRRRWRRRVRLGSAAVVLRPRRLGRRLRVYARAVPDRRPRDRGRRRRGGRAHRRHHRSVPHAGPRARDRSGRGVRSLHRPSRPR